MISEYYHSCHTHTRHNRKPCTYTNYTYHSHKHIHPTLTQTTHATQKTHTPLTQTLRYSTLAPALTYHIYHSHKHMQSHTYHTHTNAHKMCITLTLKPYTHITLKHYTHTQYATSHSNIPTHILHYTNIVTLHTHTVYLHEGQVHVDTGEQETPRS